MDTVEKTSRLLGDKFFDLFSKIGINRLRTGFSIWSDLKYNIYIDFFGYSIQNEMDILSNSIIALHKNLEITYKLNVDFFSTQSEAEEKMKERMDITPLQNNSSCRPTADN